MRVVLAKKSFFFVLIKRLLSKTAKNASKWLKMLQSAPKNTLKNAKIDKRAGITPRKRPIHIAFPPRDLTWCNITDVHFLIWITIVKTEGTFSKVFTKFPFVKKSVSPEVFMIYLPVNRFGGNKRDSAITFLKMKPCFQIYPSWQAREKLIL